MEKMLNIEWLEDVGNKAVNSAQRELTAQSTALLFTLDFQNL